MRNYFIDLRDEFDGRPVYGFVSNKQRKDFHLEPHVILFESPDKPGTIHGFRVEKNIIEPSEQTLDKIIQHLENNEFANISRDNIYQRYPNYYEARVFKLEGTPNISNDVKRRRRLEKKLKI